MGEGDDESKRTLWCGNLSDKVTEEHLYELFIQAGPLEKVKLVQGKSYSFITFQHEVSVPYTIELMSGVEFFGRKLKLQFRSRSDSSSHQNMLQDPMAQIHRSLSAPGFQSQGQQSPEIMMLMGQNLQMGLLGGRPQEQAYYRQGRYDRQPEQSAYNSPYNAPSHSDADTRHGNRHRSRGSDADYRHQVAQMQQQQQQHIEAQLAQARMIDSQRQYVHSHRGYGGGLQPWQQQQSSGRRRQY